MQQNTQSTSLAAIFHDAVTGHDAADAADNDAAARIYGKMISAVEDAAAATPCKDVADIAHRIGVAASMLERMRGNAHIGEDIGGDVDRMEALLRQTIDGLEDVCGLRREEYRLDYYLRRLDVGAAEATQ